MIGQIAQMVNIYIYIYCRLIFQIIFIKIFYIYNYKRGNLYDGETAVTDESVVTDELYNEEAAVTNEWMSDETGTALE